MTPEQKSIEVKLTILIVMLALMFTSSIFIVTRESAGVRAEAAVQGYAAALGAYQVALNAQSDRIHDLEIQSDWLRKALWQKKFPGVDEETLNKLMEVTSARRE